MGSFQRPTEEEVERINQIQSETFDKLFHLFDPPLPEGVPKRLERIAASAEIAEGESVLDVGSGTGILIPCIRKYKPGRLIACDLSGAMLKQLEQNYFGIEMILSDVRDLSFPDLSIDVVFINACYPNIVDKAGAFTNISRMMRRGGRMVISHPMGKDFIASLRETTPFPLDDFPERSEAETLMDPFGFDIKEFIDERELYILVALKRG
jgi:ubiquinone/menaquinone biosynthesis C-methylase UbiE